MNYLSKTDVNPQDFYSIIFNFRTTRWPQLPTDEGLCISDVALNYGNAKEY